MTDSQVPAQADVNKVQTIHRVMHSQLSMIELFAEEYNGVTYLLNWLKSSFDRDTKFKVPEGITDLDLKKIYHDNYATCAHLISTRCKYKHHEMRPVVEAIGFANEMAKTLKSEVEQIEPPKVEEKQPYVMDLTHIKPEQEAAQ